jgi:hypothetical protein
MTCPIWFKPSLPGNYASNREAIVAVDPLTLYPGCRPNRSEQSRHDPDRWGLDFTSARNDLGCSGKIHYGFTESLPNSTTD